MCSNADRTKNRNQAKRHKFSCSFIAHTPIPIYVICQSRVLASKINNTFFSLSFCFTHTTDGTRSVYAFPHFGNTQISSLAYLRRFVFFFFFVCALTRRCFSSFFACAFETVVISVTWNWNISFACSGNFWLVFC